jgi:hypothetical protein
VSAKSTIDPEYLHLMGTISGPVERERGMDVRASSGTPDALSVISSKGDRNMKTGWMALIFTSMVAASGCSEAWSRSFVRTDPPAQGGGVSVGLVERQCDRRIDPNWSYADILGLDIQMRVTNSAGSALTFDPRRVRLLADGEARAPHRSDASETIPSGGSKTFTVHFLERDDNLACNVPMALAVDGAAAIGSSPIPLRPVSFLASNTDI